MAVADESCQESCVLSLQAMLDASQQGASTSDEEASGKGERKSFQPYHAQSVPKPENLQAAADAGTPITTMMLRNIPNKYTQNSLLQELDDQGFAGSYDFFYLPMDVHNRSNVGYAFINFGTPKDAERFRVKFSDHRFQRFQSRKISSVCAAHVQGLDANLHHFKNRAVTHSRNGQYRPIVLKGNTRLEFEDAVAEARDRATTPQDSPKSVKSAEPCQLPPGLGPMSAPAPAPLGGESPFGREGLESAIRDLARALTRGQAVAKSPAGSIVPPPGLGSGFKSSMGPASTPAYVPLPVPTWSEKKDRRLSDAEECDFSRSISEGSTWIGFSRGSTEDWGAGSASAIGLAADEWPALPTAKSS